MEERGAAVIRAFHHYGIGAVVIHDPRERYAHINFDSDVFRIAVYRAELERDRPLNRPSHEDVVGCCKTLIDGRLVYITSGQTGIGQGLLKRFTTTKGRSRHDIDDASSLLGEIVPALTGEGGTATDNTGFKAVIEKNSGV